MVRLGTQANGRRRWLSFSLRSLLVALTLLAIAFALANSLGIGAKKRESQEPLVVISTLPDRVGSWVKIPATSAAIEAQGQPYQREGTGEIVRAWLVRGHFRDVAVHTPDNTFASPWYILETPKRIALADGNEAYTAPIDDTVRHIRVRVFWGWRNDGAWSAPDLPRIEFQGVRRLYKLYFMFDAPDESSETTRDRQFEFIDQFLLDANVILDAPPPQEDGPLLRGLKWLAR